MSLTLYSAWRATAPYRVRIGLALKGQAYDYVPVDLVAGEQHKAAYRLINPQRLTPALDLGDGSEIMTQSLAILEWLDETQPDPAFLPKDPRDRARVRAMALIIACDIHPLNNTRVGRAMAAMGVEAPRWAKWMERWMVDGFNVLEPLIATHGAGYCFGDQPSLADICLIPQVYSAQRYEVDLAAYPAIRAVAERCVEHPAFMAAHPDNQPDAQKV